MLYSYIPNNIFIQKYNVTSQLFLTKKKITKNVQNIRAYSMKEIPNAWRFF